MKKLAIATALMAATGTASAAVDIDQLQTLGQDKFRLFSEDMGAALSYKALAPAEPLGLIGFDVGVEVTSTNLANADVFEDAIGGSTSISALPVPKVHAHKGLPFGIDVGAFYAAVPESNIKLTGAELRYAILEGGIAMPALAIRGTMSSLSGVDQLDLDTKGVELTISKGFAMLTPYAGIGQVWVESTANLDGPVQLESEEFTLSKAYVGANLNLGLMNFALEGDQTGEATTYSLKMGLRF